MIFKFPALSEEDVVSLRRWLEKQKHKFLAEHHTYVSCGNMEQALKNKHYADCIEYILMMETYHTEGASMSKREQMADHERVIEFAKWIGNHDNTAGLFSFLTGLICTRCGASRPDIITASKGGAWCCYPEVP